MRSIVVFAVMSILLSSCGSSGGLPDRCAGWKPIYYRDGDLLTRPSAEEVLSHNKFGRSIGCW